MDKRDFYDEVWQTNDRIELADGKNYRVSTVGLFSASVQIRKGGEYLWVDSKDIVRHLTFATKEDAKNFVEVDDSKAKLAEKNAEIQQLKGSIQELVKRVKELSTEKATLQDEYDKLRKTQNDARTEEILKKIDVTMGNHTGLLGYIEKYYEQLKANKEMLRDLQENLITKELANE